MAAVMVVTMVINLRRCRPPFIPIRTGCLRAPLWPSSPSTLMGKGSPSIYSPSSLPLFNWTQHIQERLWPWVTDVIPIHPEPASVRIFPVMFFKLGYPQHILSDSLFFLILSRPPPSSPPATPPPPLTLPLSLDHNTCLSISYTNCL